MVLGRTLALMAAFSLVACGGGGPDQYGRTSWDVRNSPVPVPYPQKRPPVPQWVKAQQARTQVTQTRSTRATQARATQAGATQRSAENGIVTVQRGDTLFAISRRHNADLQSIVKLNNLEPPFALRVGQRLRIPTELTHVVQRGETSYGISRAYGVDLATLARANGLKPPYQVNLGQRLILPGAEPQGRTESASPPPVRSMAGTAPQTQREPSQPQRGTTTTAIAPPGTSTALAPKPPAAVAPATSGFVWPVRGRILSSYGPKPQGLHNDGINIESPAGTLFRAADRGAVVYAGNDIKAYGNLILIRHPDGWVTAYAHAQELLVKKGDQVERAQPIGRVGQMGNVTAPQLHFEIRQGRRTINPVTQLPR